MLMLAACGGDETTQPGGPVTGAGTGGLPVAGAPTATAGTTGAAGGSTTGAAGTTTGIAGRSGAAGTGVAGTGAAGTGAAGTAVIAGAGGSGTTSPTGTAGASGASGAAGAAPTAGTGGPTTGASCLDGITNYFEKGPFEVMMMRMGSINFYKPMVPAGCKVPVVHLANGTGASCSNYAESLNRLASHGFLACCYEDANTGAGTQGLMALKMSQSAFPDLADKKFGSTGHSQGGQSSFIVLQLAETEFGPEGTYAGLAMEPASGFGTQPAGGTWQSIYAKIKSPMLMFSGRGTDGLVSQTWVQDAFNAMNDTTEAYHWTKTGATHIPVPNGEEMQLSIPWFRWKLLGDQKACAAFKAIPMMDMDWSEVGMQNKKECM
jgi:hypothetical protein